MRIAAVMALAIGLASPACAEVLSFGGFTPAASDEAAALSSVLVERFGGIDGETLSFRIEDQLRAAQIDGRAYYKVLSSGSAAMGDGILRGTADSEARFEKYTVEKERCIKGADGKCTDAKEKYKVGCQRRKVQLQVTLRLTANGGRLLWSDDRPESYEDSICEDSSETPRSRLEIVKLLAARMAGRVKSDFVPAKRWDSIRVNESRKGLTKEDAERFKQAVKLTKSDASAACRVWDDLAAVQPPHVPTLFNVALCREAEGADQAAQQAYERVLQIDSRNGAAREGLSRLALNQRARRQLAAHEGQ